MQNQSNILALDVGDRRIGVALARQPVLLAIPITTIDNNASISAEIHKLITEYYVGTVVVGLPRDLDGQETAQTKIVRNFADQLAADLKVPVKLQDEAVTSVKAEAELNARQSTYNKEAVDSLAAVYILEDYIGGLGDRE